MGALQPDRPGRLQVLQDVHAEHVEVLQQHQDIYEKNLEEVSSHRSSIIERRWQFPPGAFALSSPLLARCDAGCWLVGDAPNAVLFASRGMAACVGLRNAVEGRARR